MGSKRALPPLCAAVAGLLEAVMAAPDGLICVRAPVAGKRFAFGVRWAPGRYQLACR
jgi:hypothetical protein